MIRRALALAFWLAASASAQDARPSAVVRLPGAPVGFGAEFEFTADVGPGFDDAAFRPVVVERVASEAIGGGRERRRYRARCYALGDVVLEVEPAATLRVATSLPDPPGPIEWPGDGWDLARRGPAVWPWVVLLLVLGGGGLLWARTRQPSLPDVRPTTPVPMGLSVAARLTGLELPEVGDDRAVVAFHVAVKELVREHVARRFALAAAVRTSEELRWALAEAPRSLDTCLSACDAVLFAAARPDVGALAAVRDEAVGFVRATEAAA